MKQMTEKTFHATPMNTGDGPRPAFKYWQVVDEDCVMVEQDLTRDQAQEIERALNECVGRVQAIKNGA